MALFLLLPFYFSFYSSLVQFNKLTSIKFRIRYFGVKLCYVLLCSVMLCSVMLCYVMFCYLKVNRLETIVFAKTKPCHVR
jgi:hypothetical protein